MDQIVAVSAATEHIKASTNIIMIIDLLRSHSSYENFYFEFAEFFIILVSCPVYTTTPITHSVFLRLEPLSNKLSEAIDIF